MLYGSIEDIAVNRKKKITRIRLFAGRVNISSKAMNKFIAGVIYISSAPLNRTPRPLRCLSVHVHLGACGDNFNDSRV